MRTKKSILVALSLALSLAALGAQSFDESAVLTAVDRPTIFGYLSQLGYSPENVKERSIRLTLQGYFCTVLVNETDIQVYAWFEGPADADLVNRFNSEYRFASAYYDEEGDICLQSDLDFEGGSTLGAFRVFIKTFSALLEDYSNFE